MLQRIGSELSAAVPMTILHGSRSWMDGTTGERVAELRPDSYVAVHKVQRAGHHVHAHQPDQFNAIVRDLCARVDANGDRPPGGHAPSLSEVAEES